ncbi:hypothetical protein OG883_20740 [Streptomyces sp. NBC_01142]|uniref:hypothetical protein n=1 Tax=Streptomyces sp. NBC_01142 TaxID=2975865 RepID=UPI00224CA929|nr:hypothetical protein [Streptomyces sp. NBC_01142]MCX4822270.1 hypothetical protein [Streptomyces sp. NBC_01142]
MERTAALRLDAEWAKVRSGRAGASPRARERMLKDLIAALAPHAVDDLTLTAKLSLRYGDLARHHFDTGRRADALSAVDEAIRRCEESARHDEEHARLYAGALINRAVYLAEPLSDELGLPRYAFHPDGDQPSPDVREDGLAALAGTRRAIEVWKGMDQSDPRNREGLAQAHVFLGDRLEELGHPVEAAAWAVRAEREFRALWSAPDPHAAAHGATLEHLGDQLERRLRRCPFDSGLTHLRERDLLPARLLPLAVVAARIEGVEPEPIAARLRLDVAEVRRILRAHSWRAVWRFDIREADGDWTPMGYPWRGMDAVADRSAEAVAAELTDAFLHSPDRPPPSVHWRIAVWWEEEDHLDGSRFRRTHAPPQPAPREHRTPS